MARARRPGSQGRMTLAQTDRILPGIVLMLAFCLLAPLLDVCAKLAAEGGIPVGQVTTARFPCNSR
jgi:hypothetical protein